MLFRRSRCQHRWEEVDREFRHGSLEGRRFDVRGYVADLDCHLYGFTVVELRCAECGDVTTRKLPGRREQPLSSPSVVP